MSELETRNAVIDSASIEIERGSFLVAYLRLDYGGTVQGFGGHILHMTPDCTQYQESGNGAEYIMRIMQIAGVDEWADLPGKTIRVKSTDKGVESIGHIIKDDWFTPSELFNKEQKS